MDSEDFKKYGKHLIEYIVNYNKNINDFKVQATIDPGYLKPLIPKSAPEEPENFSDILKDLDEKIMPGMLHWNHPNFFAYFGSGNSYPSVLGDLFSSALSPICFSWASCPAATELEEIILNWYGKALGLPGKFLSETPGSVGGGVLQGSASECALISMFAARARAINILKGKESTIHDSVFLPHLVAYSSKEAHSSVEKAAKMALVKLRIIDVDDRGCLQTNILKQVIKNDIAAGLTPFYVVGTVGTTGGVAFDNLLEIGKICKRNPKIWFHVDGAYGGNSFILPEMRKFAQGLELADSFSCNPNKLLLVTFDASAMWVKDITLLKNALTVDPLYLQHKHDDVIDFRHFGIPLSRRFRALKIWFVFRAYGIKGLQAYVRNVIQLGKKFESLVQDDKRFEVCNDVHLGLVCFRLRASDSINQQLLVELNSSGKIHMIPAKINGHYVIRFCVSYEHSTEDHITSAWEFIKTCTDNIIDDYKHHPEAPFMFSLALSKFRRLSFTRSTSREVCDEQIEHLKDELTPIYVVDEDDETFFNFE